MLIIPGILGLPSWQDFQPFLVTGLSLGGVYALSGVGMVVLYRATGVLNLAFGAVGAMGALIAWQLINHAGWNEWLAYLLAVLFGGVLTLAYGMVFGPALAKRDPLVKATATLGLTLHPARSDGPAVDVERRRVAVDLVPDRQRHVHDRRDLGRVDDVIALILGLIITVSTAAFLRFTKLGTAMRAMANDREITATLGVPVRRVEAAAWFGCGLLSGLAGILLADLVALDADHADVPRDVVAGRDPDRAAAVDPDHVRGRDRHRRRSTR